ncbi:glucose-repressible alcohol dehydrogenase transcriptional effector [Cryptococcus sp. DSM 104549]
MFYPHHQTQGATGGTASKHHDSDVRLGGAAAGGSTWARHPSHPSTFTPNMPMPSPGGYPPLGGGYAPPPPPIGGGGGHHHPNHVHGHGGMHGQHHPTFGAGGQGGLGGQGMGGHGPGFGGMGMFGQGGGGQAGQASPPRGQEQMPLSAFWQHQMLRAEASRLASSPHHRARAAAISSRATNKPSAVTITDPNNRPNSSQSTAVVGLHRKQASLLSVFNGEPTNTPPTASPTLTPGTNHADPATPAQPPAPNDPEGEESRQNEPWTGLDLGGIRLKRLSTALFSFNHITSLYINHNALTSIPSAISQLRQLTLLDATGNELTSIPPEIGVLSKLKELLLFDNHLTSLPYEIGTLYQLETLGIEGNPMNAEYRKKVVDEGTSGLITYLRDHAPHGVPPPERNWIDLEADTDEPGVGKQESFTVLTYNILCASFAPGTTYSYTPSWALDWDYRKRLLLEEIVTASADVICLQEIDCRQYADFFYPELKKKGYEGQHYPRSRAKTMSVDEQKLVDGCATFWKDDRFNLVEAQVVEFNQLALQKTDMRTEDMFNRVMSRDNIAVVAALEFRASGGRLLVANSHIYWDHRYRDVKLVQIGMLMEELEKIVDRFSRYPAKLDADPEYNNGRGPPTYERAEKGRDIPLIMCVDLNSLSGSAVYDYLSSGEIAGDHEDFMSHVYGPYTNKGLKHTLALRSAAAGIGEMRMTNFTPTFDAAIDYIFYTPRTMKVTSVLGDVDREYLDRTVGFPNVHFPSDHIPVFAQFRIKGQQDTSPAAANHYGNH